MEHLTKQQIVLLTLLVSFVTSIATGIVTISLANQAPPGITQTINRVVERTIEKVVPAENQGASVITKETVVVKSDDLAIQSVEENAKSIVRIKSVIDPQTEENPGVEPKEVFVGFGLVVSKDGLLIADKGVFMGRPTYIGVFADGKRMLLSAVGSDDDAHIVLFQALKDPNSKEVVIFYPATLGNSNDLKLGQSVISLSGKDRNTVALGIVSSLIEIISKNETKNINRIETDIGAQFLPLGSFLLNLSGEVVGIRDGAVNDDGLVKSYAAIAIIKNKIPAMINKFKTKETANSFLIGN